MTYGTDQIALERQRQIDEEGYDAAHDNGHAAELVSAAVEYAEQGRFHVWHGDFPELAERKIYNVPSNWPWDGSYWKPSGTSKRDLVRAGALIAAAIDSLEEEV